MQLEPTLGVPVNGRWEGEARASLKLWSDARFGVHAGEREGGQLLGRLPHLRQLLLRLAIHGRSRDLELLCGGLMSLLHVLPTEVAGILTQWAGDASTACKVCHFVRQDAHHKNMAPI